MTTSEEREAWRALWRAAEADVGARLSAVRAALAAWLDAPDALLRFRPAPGRWSAAEVLEHLDLATGFLMRLAHKVARRAGRRAERGLAWPAHPPALAALATLARRERSWPHPPHMTPHGERATGEVGASLLAGLDEARVLLALLPEGRGTLHTIRMRELGPDARLDLCGWIELCTRHAERHLGQLAANRAAHAAAHASASR